MYEYKSRYGKERKGPQFVCVDAHGMDVSELAHVYVRKYVAYMYVHVCNIWLSTPQKIVFTLSTFFDAGLFSVQVLKLSI